MTPRNSLYWRGALFVGGLIPLAVFGLTVKLISILGSGREGPVTAAPARLLSGFGWRYVESLFPGIITIPPFGDYYYKVLRARYPRRVSPSKEFSVQVVLKNLGRKTWEGPEGQCPVRLGTWRPQDRPSPFYLAGTWINPERPGTLAKPAPSSGIGLFTMTFKAPAEKGKYREELAPVADGCRWFAGEKIILTIRVC